VAFTIEKFTLHQGIGLTSLAGLTDAPFRRLCRSFGAEWVVGEMLSSNLRLSRTYKSLQRRLHWCEESPVVVQLLGENPKEMAEAARYYEGEGADVIDLNFGCPLKKVCQKGEGAALCCAIYLVCGQ